MYLHPADTSSKGEHTYVSQRCYRPAECQRKSGSENREDNWPRLKCLEDNIEPVIIADNSCHI